MIRVSLFGWNSARALVFAAVVALSALAGGACSAYSCNGIGCVAATFVHLDGNFEPGRTFDVVLIEDGPAGRGPFMRSQRDCTCSIFSSTGSSSKPTGGIGSGRLIGFTTSPRPDIGRRT